MIDDQKPDTDWNKFGSTIEVLADTSPRAAIAAVVIVLLEQVGILPSQKKAVPMLRGRDDGSEEDR